MRKNHYDTPQNIDEVISAFVTGIWFTADTDSIIVYSGFLTELLLNDNDSKVRLEKLGFTIDYYPQIKKRLLIALILGDFDKIKNLLDDPSIKKISNHMVINCKE